MSFSTSLLGPWDDMSTSHKQLISVAIPPEVKDRLFTKTLPRRGSVDKLLARLIYMVDAYIFTHQTLVATLSPAEREVFVNNLLNSFIPHLQNLDPKSLCIDQSTSA